MYQPLILPTTVNSSEHPETNQAYQQKSNRAYLIEINDLEVDNTLAFNAGREKMNRKQTDFLFSDNSLEDHYESVLGRVYPTLVLATPAALMAVVPGKYPGDPASP